MIIQDEAQRQQALDPSQSFIVQAPAGSGKTELLTQRFLVLLSQAQQPEEILALTFTKKSAAEMRARIISALKKAEANTPTESKHAEKTRFFAQKVLAQDKQLSWNLLSSPSRLRIQTIDSFNSHLTCQLPILSHFGATPEITDNPTPLYQHAVQEFLTHLEENLAWSDAIATLLLHLDNDLNKVEELLINLLAKRDQWLAYINLNDSALRDTLENQLAMVVTDILIKLRTSFPAHYTAEFMELAQYAACHLQHAPTELFSLPGITPKDKENWLFLRELLLTKENEWRKKITLDSGFPAASACKNPSEKKLAAAMKQRMQELIATLSLHAELKNAFAELKAAPEIYYQPMQWDTLAALHQVLHIIVAQLKLTFQSYGKIDYIENAQAALLALGTEDAPTDLTLALDYQIKHILVDEFQDTSNSQYRLIEKLTAGWEPHDRRTLFLVGDPMQSIYRFREAEVGLFIRARQQGIGQVKLQALTLTVNFRSLPGIVQWVNQHFPAVFPSFDDVATGAVSYSPSFANQCTSENIAPVTLHALQGTENLAQAQAIINFIQTRKQQAPTESIAILVRGRTHLAAIIPALKAAQLTYRAIDIDPLTERPFIQDLMALTRALLHPADRIAWFAILRAPWCGLSLHDLLILSGNQPNCSLWERLTNEKVITALSTDGQQRLNRILPVLKIKLAERLRTTLRYWIESTWLLLGGPACLTQEAELEDAQAYFKLIEKLAQKGEWLNLDTLQEEVGRLYAAPNHQADHSLQIMTIHNAKGLEFDTVILPHLEKKASHDDKQLLLWMERPCSNGHNALILAPVHAVGNATDSIYEYIKKQHTTKNAYERSRLLYVAVTRAKKNLALFFNLEPDGKPNSNSLLEKLWPGIQPEILIHEAPFPSLTQITRNELTLKSLVTDWENPITEKQNVENLFYQQKSGFQPIEYNAKYIGLLVHQLLQQISLLGYTWWEQQTATNQLAYLKKNLLQLGMALTDSQLISSSLHQSLTTMLADPRARWILAPHKDAHSEFQLTAILEGQLQQLIIDRTFIDENNVRWIIDYKTATCPPAEISAFLLKQQQKHQLQMMNYLQAMQQIEQRPIRLGLYFPLLPAWHEWAASMVNKEN